MVMHFRSHDKDGDHTIRSAVFENPMLYADFMALCFIEQELLAIEFDIAEIWIFDRFAPLTLTLTR